MMSMYLHAILSLLLCAECSFAEDVKCEINQNPVGAKRGDTVSLPCIFHSSSQHDRQLLISWQMELGNELLMVYAENSSWVLQNKKFESRTTISRSWTQTGNATLQIMKVQSTDSGNYTCYVRAEGRAACCAHLQLTVSSGGTFKHCGHPSAWITFLLLSLMKLLT
ncbi:CD276 antigen-like [Heterodontus francisci]|uniref:CD276 antigen-like n=1 Tax=Heterodontus francisci TaxID=7792 RepID=UPI00355C4294